MKLQKVFLVLIILFASFHVCFGQAKPKAVQVDEFGFITCDDFLSRVDNFFIELENHPNSQGYAVISGENNYLKKKLTYGLWLNGAIREAKRDGSNITKIRSEETGDFKIQFWIVPAGADKPNFNEAEWNFVFPPKTKPFVFHDDYEQICSSVSFEKVYTEYLSANPKSRGHIVIYGKSLKEYQTEKKEAQNLLSDIPQRQLRFFYVKSDYPNVEFWLVPNKKN